MSAAQDLLVQMLFIKSAEDEQRLVFDVPDAVFEFHTQQAIEKLLKALISANRREFPFTHDLGLLMDQLESLGEQVPDFGIPLPRFTQYAVLVRYDAGVSLSGMERDAFRQLVADLRQFVQARVAVLP